MTSINLGILAFFLTLNLSAAESPDAVGKETQENSQQPVVSASGKKRIQENIAILEQNLKGTNANLATLKENLQATQREIDSLASIEKDYIEMKSRYANYLAGIQKEVAKNEASLGELNAFIEKLTKPENAATPVTTETKAQLEKAATEKTEREKWKSETSEKMKRVETLVQAATKSLREIDSRKIPLRSRLSEIELKEKDYQTLRAELLNKKQTAEKLAAQ